MEEDIPVSWLHVDILEQVGILSGRQAVRNEGVDDILARKDYQSIDMVFTFITRYVCNKSGLEKDARLTKANTIFSEPAFHLCSDRSLREIKDVQISYLKNGYKRS